MLGNILIKARWRCPYECNALLILLFSTDGAFVYSFIPHVKRASEQNEISWEMMSDTIWNIPFPFHLKAEKTIE